MQRCQRQAPPRCKSSLTREPVKSRYGAGFALYEGSARGNAQAGALTARADDPSAVYYNPAGITQLPEAQFMGGLTLVTPSTEVVTLTPVGRVSAETEDHTFYIPHLYATWAMKEQVWLGLGLYSRFGLGTAFPENWPGRYNNYKAFIQSLTLNPNLAYKVSDQLSLAAGVSAVWMDLDLRRKIKLPDMWFLGVAFMPTDKLSLEIGAVRAGWSSYEELAITLKDPTLLGTPNVVSPKDWEEWTIDLSCAYLDIRDRTIPARPLAGIFPSEFRNGDVHMVGVSVSRGI